MNGLLKTTVLRLTAVPENELLAVFWIETAKINVQAVSRGASSIQRQYDTKRIHYKYTSMILPHKESGFGIEEETVQRIALGWHDRTKAVVRIRSILIGNSTKSRIEMTKAANFAWMKATAVRLRVDFQLGNCNLPAGQLWHPTPPFPPLQKVPQPCFHLPDIIHFPTDFETTATSQTVMVLLSPGWKMLT